MESIQTQFGDLLGISFHTVGMIMTGVVCLVVVLAAWKFTGNPKLAIFSSIIVLIGVGVWGIIPIWAVIMFTASAAIYLLFAFLGGLASISGNEEEEMPNQLIQDQKKLKPATTNVAGDLLKGFQSIDFHRGVKVLNNLNAEHSRLVSILSHDWGESLINTKRMKKLELDIYDQGLRLLTEVLETARHLTATNIETLENESKELSEELGRYKDDSSKATLVSIIEERLKLNQKGLIVAKRYNDRIDELVCQAELCVDSLRDVSLTLPELVEHKPKDELDRVLIELGSRIEFAQRVKAEYAKQGI